MDEHKTHHSEAKKHTRRDWFRAGALGIIFIVLAGGFVYWRTSEGRIFIDTASVVAPEIDLAPSTSGVLEEVFVHEGDQIPANAVVARVGNELLKAKVAGIVISVPANVGALVNPNQTVVTMIDPSALRIVGRIDEDKGLSQISVGDRVVFTVDAFGGKKYSAVVDEVAPSSQESGIVFNISDKREVKQFDIKARFDTNAYSELKNGMSARMWVYH
jgi:multidrug resistance efflux pump